MDVLEGKAHEVVAKITAIHATQAVGASEAAGNTIECIVGATTPLINSLFTGGTLQERLLFVLVLAGACATLREETDTNNKPEYSLRIQVCPETLREAFTKFTHLTGTDMRPNLPPSMVKFSISPLN